MIDTKRFLSLLLALLLLLSAACAAEEDTWICLTCGQDASGDTCAYCGETRDVWTCADCGTRNLSDTCSQCGKEKKVSLAVRASSPYPLTAFPALRVLAASGDAESLFKLGRYYEKGLFVNRDDEQALRCYRDAAEAGYAPAWVYLGRLYDAGVMVKPDAAFALDRSSLSVMLISPLCLII